MSSLAARTIIDDDDDFDWDAAVKQIDVACDETKPSTSRSTAHFRFSHKKSICGKYETSADEINGQFGGDDALRHVNIDVEAAKTWIYPVNIPLRDYQLSITRTALFSNTLVALPTGLGKTLIAAVVMYNYFRWFPEGKIVFAAPSRPLVMQQIEACHNIMGIPQGWTIDMTGQTSPAKRARLWKERRVFFLTPQVLEKDIHSGTCKVKYLVCLVIDEAHRAHGNYSYCVAIRKLMSARVELRILALTATPGSKPQTIQEVIDNLLISTLEYRDESDQDVSTYVHNRKVELIQVAMCEYAVEASNLLLEAIRPFVARLSAIGVLPRRDLQTLSPCDLVTSREKFRESPPQALDQMKYGEIEGYFAVLITLYYIRKLLSSHGIRPAYEMLEEKLKQGFFARLMSKNEFISKAKDLMQKSLHHGAPNPKLSKLLEVLDGHFRTNDAQNSRVIIFSNFRGSVRDVLVEITKIGSFIRATEFIGQNSGKLVKGQTQKVQQAVLEKFRAGKYNVIVATSIGEEGLDIMDVDLVICFDANISPLRMIQRMGRTGRKHDGRVVVLACEGPELKGYMRKQASNNAMGKHMKNGGNSFKFHPSPRMVPHIIKPEIHFVEMLIEQYVPRGRKPKDEPHAALSTLSGALSDAESAVLAKYFQPSLVHQWRPSLIAFPNFQTRLSGVHTVSHSSRTGMLIDAMQHFRRSDCTSDSRSYLEDKCCRGLLFLAEQDDGANGQHNDECSRKVQSMIDLNYDATFPRMGTMEANNNLENENSNGFHSSDIVAEDGEVKMFHVSESNLKSPICQVLSNEGGTSDVSFSIESQSPSSPTFPAGDCCKDSCDSQLSPRITTFILSGIVPESPIHDGEPANAGTLDVAPDDLYSCIKKSSSLATIKKVNCHIGGMDISPKSPTLEEIEVHAPEAHNVINAPDEVRTSLADLTNTSSKDWYLSSQDRSRSAERVCKFKRLRKHGDACKRTLFRRIENNSSTCTENSDVFYLSHPRRKSMKGGVKRVPNARAFIEEEAEVSDAGEDSSDEEDDPDTTSQDDSFIDDRLHFTSASTQVGGGSLNMMAIYRRSLLSQSPCRTAGEFFAQIREADSVDHLHSPNSPLSASTRDRRPEKKTYKLGCIRNLNSHHVASVASESYNNEPETATENVELNDDDQFYEGLDFDVVEAEATMFLRSRQEMTQKKGHVAWQENGPADSPSFDLGV